MGANLEIKLATNLGEVLYNVMQSMSICILTINKSCLSWHLKRQVKLVVNQITYQIRKIKTLMEKNSTIKNGSDGLVAKSCQTLCNPIEYSLPGSSVHGIFQATILEWIAISRGEVAKTKIQKPVSVAIKN